MGTLRFFEEVVSFKIRRTFGFADYRRQKEQKIIQFNLFFHPDKQKQDTLLSVMDAI